MWIACLNFVLTAAFDAWWFVLSVFPHWARISITALIIAPWLLLAFQVCRPRPIRFRANSGSGFHAVGFAPYQQDPGAPQASRWKELVNTLRHFGLPLLPFLAMCLPVVLVVAQVEARSSWRAIEPNEPLIFSATLTNQASAGTAISGRNLHLSLPAGLVLGAPPLRNDKERTIFWRVYARAPGTLPVRIGLDGTELEIDVVAGETFSATPPRHYRAGDWRTLAYPAATPLPADSPFQSVTIAYPRRGSGMLGISNATWLLLGLSFMSAFVLCRLR